MHTYNRKKTIERIKSLLKDNHITQDYLAEILDTYSSRVSDCMRNKKDFTTDQLFTIARHFNVSLDYLLGLNEDTTIAETKPERREISCLSDALELILQLFDTFSVSIVESDYATQSTDYYIYLNNKKLQQFLGDYKNICAISDTISKSTPFHIWKNMIISEYKAYKKNYNFQDFHTFKHNVLISVVSIYELYYCPSSCFGQIDTDEDTLDNVVHVLNKYYPILPYTAQIYFRDYAKHAGHEYHLHYFFFYFDFSRKESCCAPPANDKQLLDIFEKRSGLTKKILSFPKILL